MHRSSWLLALFLAQRRNLRGQAARITGDPGSAEDVMQEAWLRFSAATPAHAMAEPAGYLRRIVRNLALDERRRRERREQVTTLDPEADPERIAACQASVEQAVISAQELALVTIELARMSPRMRRAVELHRVSGAALREVADELGVSITTAHKLVTDGVERCRRCLDRASD